METVRRNGYYCIEGKQVPSVTTVCRGGGSAAAGLMGWAAEQGALRVVTELAKVKDLYTLEQTLGSHDSLEWAKAQGRIGFQQGGAYARMFGTEVHRLLEDLLKGSPDNTALEHLPEHIVTAYRTYENFFTTSKLKPVAIEDVIFYDSEVSYAGRFDLIAEVTKEAIPIITPHLGRGCLPIVPGLYMVDFKTGGMYPAEHKAQLSAYTHAWEIQTKQSLSGGLILNVDKKEVDKLKIAAYTREELANAYEQGFVPAYKAWLYWEAPKWYLNQDKSVGK